MQIVEHFLCIFFTLETLIRLFAYKHKRDCFKDLWFLRDALLAILLLLETWILTSVVYIFELDEIFRNMGDFMVLRIYRLGRLTRLARIAKVLKAIPELAILIKGLFVATRSVCFTFVLLIVVIYVYGIAFTNILDDDDTGVRDEYFSNVAHSMSTLLLHGCLGEDFPDLAKQVAEVGYGYAATLISFVVLGQLTIMNLLTGVLVEVVGLVATLEREEIICADVKNKMKHALRTLDSDNDNLISIAEFMNMVEVPTVIEALSDLGVDPSGLVDLTEGIFQEKTEIEFQEFMELVLQLRGSNTTTVRDMIDLRRLVTQELSRMEERIVGLIKKDVQSSAAPPAKEKSKIFVNRGITQIGSGASKKNLKF